MGITKTGSNPSKQFGERKKGLENIASVSSSSGQNNNRRPQTHDNWQGDRERGNNNFNRNGNGGGNRGGEDWGDHNGGSPFYPIPSGIVDQVKKSSANFSLSFIRLMRWTLNGNEIKKPADVIESLYKVGQEQIRQAQVNAALEAIHQRQKEAMESLGKLPIEIRAKLVSPFISGLGSGHPNETGIILDRNTGCPFLPASSIKGVLRLAYALKLADDNHSIVEIDKDGQATIDDKYLDKYFGSTNTEKGKRGQLVILDAYPAKAPSLKIDIMNPHYGDYYIGKKKSPVETENPVPIKFISVAKDTEFIFRAFFLPLEAESFNDSDKQEIEGAFKEAFEYVGFGGKTAIGYGRFKIK
ncbi:MAG: type III-B CRISPR module RAMP protein Cmr6 [Helicobacteraceae bacterium]|jgi:CRISPR-associated protein Cmr6|nr:type III-B CRISPR module RAMP protein Cmr6 [Helicobacteraceae bacterium]